MNLAPNDRAIACEVSVAAHVLNNETMMTTNLFSFVVSSGQ